MTMRQDDLFRAAPRSAENVEEAPDPAAIRARLHALLAIAKEATRMPWEPSRARAQEYLFANMTNWLPQQEGMSLREAFAKEIARLQEK